MQVSGPRLRSVVQPCVLEYGLRRSREPAVPCGGGVQECDQVLLQPGFVASSERRPKRLLRFVRSIEVDQRPCGSVPLLSQDRRPRTLGLESLVPALGVPSTQASLSCHCHVDPTRSCPAGTDRWIASRPSTLLRFAAERHVQRSMGVLGQNPTRTDSHCCLLQALTNVSGPRHFKYMLSGKRTVLLARTRSHRGIGIALTHLTLSQRDSQGHRSLPARLRWSRVVGLIRSESEVPPTTPPLKLAAGANLCVCGTLSRPVG